MNVLKERGKHPSPGKLNSEASFYSNWSFNFNIRPSSPLPITQLQLKQWILIFYAHFILKISATTLPVYGITGSVVDPPHFGMDPDLRICTTDLWILFFSSVAFKMLTKNFFCWLLFEVTFTSVFKDKMSSRSRKTVELKVFLTIFVWWWKDPDPYPYK